MEAETSSDSDTEGLSRWGGAAAPPSSLMWMSREHDSNSSADSAEEESLGPEEEPSKGAGHNSGSSTESSEEEQGWWPESGRAGRAEEEFPKVETRGDRATLVHPQTQETYELFQRFVTNRAGALSFDDVKRAVHELWPQFDHELPLRRAYEAADRDANGDIGRREFHLLLSNIVHFDSLWVLFDTIEAGNPENRMELEDFQAACAAVGLATTENVTAAFTACTQAEGVAEAHLGFDHFCDWMLKQKRKTHLTGAVDKTRRAKPAPPARKPKKKQPVPAKVGRASHQESETESDGDEDGVLSGTRVEPEPERVYDSDSSGSELSDDDAAVALLARIQNSPFRGGGTPARDGTPVQSASTVSAQARLSQLLDELGSPPQGRGAARSRRASSRTTFHFASATKTPREEETLQAVPGSERKHGLSDVASSSGGLQDSSSHDRLYAAALSSAGQRENSIHDRLHAHKTASTSVDVLAKVDLQKHGLSKEAMEMKATAEKLKADARAEQRAADEQRFREERQRAAKERQRAKEQRVKAMRMAALADKKRSDELRNERQVQKAEDKAAAINARREALEYAREVKQKEKKEEEELLKERRQERERQAAIDAKIDEDRRKEKRRDMLTRREHMLEMRQHRIAAEKHEADMLFESRIDANMAAEVQDCNANLSG